MINKENLKYGRMPENNYEIVVDKLVIDKLINSEEKTPQMAGINETQELLNRKIIVPNMENLTLVGIVDFESPSIYMDKDLLINVINCASYTNDYDVSYGFATQMQRDEMQEAVNILDYKMFDEKIQLKKGRMPEKDYEVIVNSSHEYEMKLNKTIDMKVNDKKLTVVGYYTSKDNIDYYLVNNNTIKYKLISEKDGFTVYAKDKNQALDKYKKMGINIKDSYQSAKDEYLEKQKEDIKADLTSAAIIAIISLIEIFLMTRASFLSRIKEIGILRAIGVKKIDIYKMFAGEIIAITTLVSLPAVLLTAYVLNTLKQVTFFSSYILINLWIVLLVLIILYGFNLLVGLIPVYRVIRKTPAQILSRNDI